MNCPLCLSSDHSIFLNEKTRFFHRCYNCELIYLDKEFYLSSEAEKERYNHHQNDVNDKNYHAFLNRLLKPLSSYLKLHMLGLDFGCGHGPAVAGLLKNKVRKVENYDPFYFPNTSLLEQSYDFITSTEVVEHLQKPFQVFEKLANLLTNGAILGLMTSLYDEQDFKSWYYKNDPTHIVFYSKKTIEWIASRFAFKILQIESPVIILRKV